MFGNIFVPIDLSKLHIPEEKPKKSKKTSDKQETKSKLPKVKKYRTNKEFMRKEYLVKCYDNKPLTKDRARVITSPRKLDEIVVETDLQMALIHLSSREVFTNLFIEKPVEGLEYANLVCTKEPFNNLKFIQETPSSVCSSMHMSTDLHKEYMLLFYLSDSELNVYK